jgi:hypothetical protein
LLFGKSIILAAGTAATFRYWGSFQDPMNIILIFMPGKAWSGKRRAKSRLRRPSPAAGGLRIRRALRFQLLKKYRYGILASGIHAKLEANYKEKE